MTTASFIRLAGCLTLLTLPFFPCPGAAQAFDRTGPAGAEGIGKLPDERAWYRGDRGYNVRNVRGNEEFAPEAREAVPARPEPSGDTAPRDWVDIYTGRESGRDE